MKKETIDLNMITRFWRYYFKDFLLLAIIQRIHYLIWNTEKIQVRIEMEMVRLKIKH
jgi:hypothetical protein